MYTRDVHSHYGAYITFPKAIVICCYMNISRLIMNLSSMLNTWEVIKEVIELSHMHVLLYIQYTYVAGLLHIK